ncbi:MAG: ClpX, ATPase regulatory subunit [Spirosoma sp.]|nr:ClpX, ATPase regulatory subunit [Spirosoma sp.]
MKSVRLFAFPCAFLLAALSFTPAGVWAQNERGPVVPRAENYLLGPGDVLSVTVAGFPEFSQERITVPPDGVISLPTLGSVRMTGRTRAAVQADIRQKLIQRARLRNPQVAVAIVAVRPDVVGSVVLAGDVPRGGSFPIREGERLSDLLAEAGLSERLEERRATLVRGSTRLALDLSSAASRPGSAADVRLRAGDSIAVRAIAAGKITIQGDVEKPGTYELHRQPRGELFELGLAPRLSDLINKAGGLKTLDESGAGGATSVPPASGTGGASGGNPFAPGASSGTGTLAPTAPLQNTPRLPTSYTATLQRDGGRRSLDVEAATNDIAGAQNIYLKSGDFVSVRLVRPITVYLDGAATKTGSFQLAPGAGVLELLTLAGPLTRAAGDLKASVRRGDQTLPLDLPALLLSSESSANVRLQNGDIVQLREPETVGVSVAGQVVRPGAVRLRPGGTIFEALLAAGGISPVTNIEGARLNVLRREKDGSLRVYGANAAGILGLTDVSTNLVLRDGDIVNVARGEDQTVFVSGEVLTPGTFQILPGEGLAQVLTRAGGPKDDAALTLVTVTHKGQVQTVDVYDAVKNARPLNFALQAGDIVNVPLNSSRVLALESFSKPGYFAIPERGQLTFLDLLAQAQPTQGVKKIYILQANSSGMIDPKAQPRRTILLEDVRRGRQENFALSPRDIIFAEPPKNKKNLLDTLSSLSLLRVFF